MAGVARRMAWTVAGLALAGLVLATPITVGAAGPSPAGRQAGAPGASAVTTVVATADHGRPYPSGRRWR